jgi:predicted ABC-type exoprotein transport system permease subunit
VWESETTFSQTMKEKLKAQETKPNSNFTQKKTNTLLFNREFLKSRSPLQVLVRLLL